MPCLTRSSALFASPNMDLARLERQARSIRFPIFEAGREVRPGRHRTTQRGHGSVVADIREYQYGDEIRNLDWNVTARFGKPYVKVFEQEHGSGVLLVLDFSASLVVGAAGSQKEMFMREVAVVLALAATHQGERLGALLFTDHEERVIPPRRGQHHAHAVVRVLQHWQPAGRGTNLTSALNAARRVMQKPGLVIILSDFLDWEYVTALRGLRARHSVLSLCINDAAERVLPRGGLVRFVDPETGTTRLIDTSAGVVHRAFERKWRDIDARRHAVFTELCIPALDLNVGRPYLPLLNDYGTRPSR
jgi:uncharacterized protein (DUF58 family)